MTQRKQDQSVENKKAKQEHVIAAPAVFTPPSQDEEAFLKGIAQTSEGYDPKVTVGGPSNFTA
jgi:hypothetical protein